MLNYLIDLFNNGWNSELALGLIGGLIALNWLEIKAYNAHIVKC